MVNLAALDPAKQQVAVPPGGYVRFLVLGAFALLAALTYLDRICMAQAAGPIRAELGLNEWQMGLVFSAFTLAYALCEIPTGRLVDRIGPRKVLTRIILWWSAFTSLTGLTRGLGSLLAVRFAFGMGEAGAFPGIACALTRWFPPSQRGRIQGVIWSMARVGGALAPPLTAALIAAIGWRHTFLVFGAVGLVWVIPFWFWYRDDPETNPRVSPEERAWIRSWTVAEPDPGEESGAPWRRILTNRSVQGLAGATFWSAFGWYFFISWLPTYLETERGLSLHRAAWLAGLPLLFGIAGCALGGWLGDRLSARLGSTRWSRRLIGSVGMTSACVCFLLGVRAADPVHAVLLMALASFFNDLPASSLWAANMDIGERHAGSVSGVVGTSSAVGAVISPLLFGFLLNRGWGWTPALVMAGLAFLCSGLSWLLVDSTRTVSGKPPGFEVDPDFP
ncbi:MAG: MFS transporter [Isosphaeraceae bacterium]